MSEGDAGNREDIRITEHFAERITSEMEQMAINKIMVKSKYNVDISRMTIIEYLLFVEHISKSTIVNPNDYGDNGDSNY